MPNPTQFPVRPQDQSWPGLRSKRGVTITARPGEMSDCSNVEILSDQLMKRRGFIRGLDEFFDTPICGLFIYTDFCQNEWLLVATASGITIRQPFTQIAFQIADCYPFDEFAGTGLQALNSDDWKFVGSNLGIDGNVCGLKAISRAFVQFDVESIIDSYSATWFKESCKSSYEVSLNLDLPDSTFEPHAAAIIRGAQKGFQSGAFLMGDFFRRDNLTFGRIMHISGSRAVKEVATIGPFEDGNGVGKISYNQAERSATITFTPDVGSPSSSTFQFNGVQDDEFGLATGFSVFFIGPTAGQNRPSSLAPPSFGIDDIQAEGL